MTSYQPIALPLELPMFDRRYDNRMSEDLQNEIEALNSIYGDGSLIATGHQGVYVLHLSQHAISLRLQIPAEYPSTPPSVLGTESSGENARKGEAAHIVEIFREVLGDLFLPGEVCLFDVIEEVNTRFNVEDGQVAAEVEHALHNLSGLEDVSNDEYGPADDIPSWVLSDVIIEMKSIFIARTASVSSTDQATNHLQHLLDSDKKVRSATHNITAWRIRGENGVTYQDCDDDGETAAGGRVLHLMQLMDVWNVMVVVTRWYGGHHLGPKRFSVINSVARDALVKGGFVKEEPAAKKKSKH